MSRNSLLVVIGALWSLTTTVYLSLQLNPELAVATPILAVVLCLSAFATFASELTASKGIRTLGFLTHFFAPVVWLCFFSAIQPTTLVLLLLCVNVAIGSGLSDLGLYLETHEPDLGYENEAFLKFVQKQQRQAALAMSQLSKFDSGSYRPLAAYDSGGFTIPRL